MNDQKKPVAINLMEIWLTGRELERPNALWRPCKRDNTPAADWRPMNRTVAKRAVRSGVFTVTHAGVQHLFCAREIPRTALQLTDYARLKELIAMRKAGEQLPALVLPEATQVPAENMPAMEDVYAPELAEAVPTGTEPSPEQLDAAADSVIADITGESQKLAELVGDARGEMADANEALNEAAEQGIADGIEAQKADAAAQSGVSPTPLSDNVNSLATDGGVSIPSPGNSAGTTEEGNDKQSSDGGREGDRGSEVQGNA